MTPEQAAALRAPFPAAAIGSLPRGGIQLSYVGHAAVCDRLLAVDPAWGWEPAAVDEDGLPLVRHRGKDAVLWIRLTVCGVTRPGVGIVADTALELEKQLISDALRNAAMRFGVALDLWSKDSIGESAPAPEPEHRPDIDALQARVVGLVPSVSSAFMAWKGNQDFRWPWPVAAVQAMNDKLDTLEWDTAAADAADMIAGPGEPTLLGTAAGTTAVAAASPEPSGYDHWKKDELLAECLDRQIDLGHQRHTNAELIALLRGWDITYRPGVAEADGRPF